MSLTSLNDATTGAFRIETESSSYVILIDKNIGMRIPGDDAANLRKDGEWFRVHKILNCTIGKPMNLLCSEINESLDVFTTRLTTNVVKIREIGDGDD